MYDKNMPNNNLLPIPPAANLETVPVLKKTIAANKALAELRGWEFTQVNPLLLLQSITLQEAKASSEIENVVTTNDELYQALSTPVSANITPAAKEVMHCKEALWYGYKKVKENHPLTVNLFIDLFRIVKKRQDGIRTVPGTCLKNVLGEVVYTPPDNKEDIFRLLTNLENYINLPDGNGVDPLIKLGVIHYQFECIHPFPDGNGRVGRILNVLYLIQEKLLNFPILYLSRYIIENKTEYYRALKCVTENQEWERWLLYVLDAVEQTAKDTLDKVKSIYSCREYMAKEIKEKLPGIYSKELVELIFEQPYCKIDFLTKRGIAKTQTSSKYLRQLHEAGFMDVQKIGHEKYYINRMLWDILTR